MANHFCTICRQEIVFRWVREKIYGSGLNGTAPAYRYFHAEPAKADEESCHEKFQRQKELEHTAT